MAQLPKVPGVYLYKNKAKAIIYVGKAAVLRNRVRQYFQVSRIRDPKTDALVAEIADVEWIEVETEIDALFLEAELIRRYLPRYNILLRDDKSYVYIRVNYNDPHPTVTATRRPLDDHARYFGPYSSTVSIKRALKYLRRAFPYSTHDRVVPKRACLHYHLGLCPGLEEDKTSLTAYRANLRQLMRYFKGERVALVKSMEIEMKRAAAKKDFEAAALARDRLRALKQLNQQVLFSDRELLDMSKDNALVEMTELLGLQKYPRRIEGYDISHMQGTDTVASMVVFSQGLPDKTNYRKFKMRVPGNDDFAHMREVIARRFSEENRKQWGMPDLILIDGGKGQLSAALAALAAHNLSIPTIGLAKREEEIIVHALSHVAFDAQVANTQKAFVVQSGDFTVIRLPLSSNAVKLLQRIRDESHRFAVSYHSVLKTKRQTASLLDDIPTIGPATRKKLLRTFGSVKGITQARDWELAKLIGEKKAVILRQYLRTTL